MKKVKKNNTATVVSSARILNCQDMRDQLHFYIMLTSYFIYSDETRIGNLCFKDIRYVFIGSYRWEMEY